GPGIATAAHPAFGLCRVRQTAACRVQKRVSAPRLAKNGNSIGAQHASQFSSSNVEIQVMQYGIAPNAVERGVRERQTRAVGLDKVDDHIICTGTTVCLDKIAGRKIKSGDMSATAREHDCCHPVAAAIIEDALPREITKMSNGRPDPCFMIQVR